MSRCLAIFVAIAGWGLSSCSSLPDNWFAEKAFEAKDGSYFPDFLLQFFPRSDSFQKRFPTISQARRGIRLIQVKPLVTEKNRQNESNLSWSRNGQYLSYETSNDRHRSIYIRELTGRFHQNLTVQRKRQRSFLDGIIASRIQSYNSGLTWSPTEQQYAFMSNGGVGEYNIYVGSVENSPEVVAQSPSKDGYATWGPFQDEIAFVSSRSGNGDIYLLQLKDQNVQRISDSPNTELFPEWLPKGKGIVYTSGPSSSHQIVVRRRDQKGWGRTQMLTQWPNDNLRPKVSPSGEWVAFYGSQNSHWNIYVLPLGGETSHETSMNRYVIAEDVVVDLNTGPAWSPDSSKIFFVKRDPSRFNPIYAYDLRVGKAYHINTKTKMNRDMMMSSLGVLSFRAQVGAWDRVYVALTNLGHQIQGRRRLASIRSRSKHIVHSHRISHERVNL
ncbi:TolB family protein [Pseudobacteriovorax antillogorgiicola]|uniref:WD40-like Beta Propeller Repeat n=1 Tax=Pseudobacteriovorax antillogorgiicola TaxID=1513793 RepID=A0A1Y6CI63_9BACT|nr:PD40 domain-containing protein [Pseudobacteriovorax antillogorgiicola]TCS46724.1 WD40 repeat protein [Pseudobacteriovorax antillogorgiicola]SMF67135.1 WD40-like Beta Propeller Repeat [Pseudobacteriovorax antillogorgiicola]